MVTKYDWVQLKCKSLLAKNHKSLVEPHVFYLHMTCAPPISVELDSLFPPPVAGE